LYNPSVTDVYIAITTAIERLQLHISSFLSTFVWAHYIKMHSLGSESSASSVNYFTCTLGQAAELNPRKLPKYHTINEFIDIQTEQCPDSPAVGFPIHANEDRSWSFELFC
jgi:hypothetical protein